MGVPEKLTKRIRIDFKGAKGELKEAIKREVGEFVVDEIINHLDSSKSPVSEGKFKVLKKDKTRSTLFDFGDLYSAIDFETFRDGVEVGVFSSSEVAKAYGHNSGFKGHPTIPEGKYTREFIPTKDKEFKSKILTGIRRIVEDKIE